MGLEFHCVNAFSDAPYQGAPKRVPCLVSSFPCAIPPPCGTPCFDRSAWARSSTTVTLPPQILAIAPAGTETAGTPRIEARLFGLDIAPQDDPPIGSAMPALASYLALSEPADPLRIVALRGMGHGRLSMLQLIAQRSGRTVIEVSVGEAVTPIAQGQLIAD